jgi:hypothetical protein
VIARIDKSNMLTHLDDFSRVVVGDLGHPARADAVGAVDQHHGDDGDVPLGLDLLVVVGQVLEDLVVVFFKNGLGERARPGRDEMRRGFVLAISVPSSELEMLSQSGVRAISSFQFHNNGAGLSCFEVRRTGDYYNNERLSLIGLF